MRCACVFRRRPTIAAADAAVAAGCIGLPAFVSFRGMLGLGMSRGAAELDVGRRSS